jgi:dTDP-4-amino-4,6-dideoxygalactose transaminase
MPAILEIAKQHGLAVIEDAAHAVGASLDGQALGTWGDVGVFSFFGNKNLTTGEGGMVVTNDDRLAAKLGILRSHGMTTLTWDRHRGHASTYDVVDLGYNYRIDEMRSALGREQLKKLLAGNARRAELVGLYRELLAELAPEVKVPFEAERGLSSYHIMAVLLPEGSDKLKLMEAMKAQRIQTSWHYPPVHTFTVFRDRRNWSDALRLTEAIAKREVTLPLYPGMRDEQVEMVVQALRESLAYAA